MKIKNKKKDDEFFYEDLVNALYDDFYARQRERRQIEKQWELNLNYLSGNQYCEISASGEVEESDKYYFWQDRNVYNHIAPIMDSRIARLTRVRPVMSVRAAGSEESDVKTAKLTTAVLNSSYVRIGIDDEIFRATVWSETCGTAFYKVIWDGGAGRKIGEKDGKPVYEGDVKVEAVSPFEIFPDSLCAENIEDVESLIHARAVRTEEIFRTYGVRVDGGDVDVFSLNGSPAEGKGVLHDSVLLIEKYERPSEDYPDGRFIVVADKKILYIGELPYVNGAEGRRDIPFIRQTSIAEAGSFFGSSMVRRLIPVQRAYNAVKNRKQEFLNRLSMGVLTVEDGSVDTDDLAEEGLSPGKIIVYRQGSNPPSVMGTGNVPNDLSYEEDRLLNEFILISGVSEFSRSSSANGVVTSGVALQLLIEQEDTRMTASGESVRAAVKLMAKQIIRLFRQFAKGERIMKSSGETGKVEMFYFRSSDLSSDDVVFDTENELSFTPAQKKSAVYDLIKTGILSDETGKMNERTKAKVLEMLGFGSIDNALDLEKLHINKAESENVSGYKVPTAVDEYDDHALHIAEHTRFLLSSDSEEVRNNAEAKENALAHLREHKARLAEANAATVAANE